MQLYPQSLLDVRPIQWLGLPRRFINPGELEVLCAMLRKIQARHVIEIGVNVGRTAKLIMTNVHSIERYTGVDVSPDYKPSLPIQRHEVPADPGALAVDDPRFRLVVRPRGSLDLEPADLEPCCAMFIDGDHSRGPLLHDTALGDALVRMGGLIIWHDYHDEGTVDVKAVLREFAAAGRPVQHVEKTWIAFQYVNAGRPFP